MRAQLVSATDVVAPFVSPAEKGADAPDAEGNVHGPVPSGNRIMDSSPLPSLP
jgi:hypothetical protein